MPDRKHSEKNLDSGSASLEAQAFRTCADVPSGSVTLPVSRRLRVRITVVVRKWMFWILSVLRVCTSGMDCLVSSEARRQHFSEKNFPNVFSRLVIKSSRLLFRCVGMSEPFLSPAARSPVDHYCMACRFPDVRRPLRRDW